MTRLELSLCWWPWRAPAAALRVSKIRCTSGKSLKLLRGKSTAKAATAGAAKVDQHRLGNA